MSATIPRSTAGSIRRARKPHTRLQTPGRGNSPFVPSPSIAAQSQSSKRRICPQSDCRSLEIFEDDGQLVCGSCGFVLDEGNPYVSDQQWTEAPSGATQAQGTYVGEGQTHSRGVLNMPGRGHLLGGDSATDGSKTKMNAKNYIRSVTHFFGIAENIGTTANTLFDLALGNGFLSGRTLESVCAVCFYVACRRVRDQENRASAIMLIDVAEHTNMNVFLLGSTYTKFVDKIMLKGSNNPAERVEAMPPETLVSRFARELEFGRDTSVIKRDAVNIVRRMNRDWMTTGRRQAGIVGAAIILAARMNNYRRTVREVVLVAKVTEITINKRLEEFQFTDSSKLTVDTFRDGNVRDALREMDPPSYYRAMGLGPHKKKKRKRGRPRKTEAAETATEIDGEEDDQSSEAQVATKRIRLDAEGFKIPPLPSRATPIDPRLEVLPLILTENSEQETAGSEDSTGTSILTTTSQTGLQRKPPANPTTVSASLQRARRKWKLGPPSEYEIEIENELEGDILYGLDRNAALLNTSESLTAAERAASREIEFLYQPVTVDEVRTNDPTAPVVSAWQSTPEAGRPAVNTNLGNTGTISLSQTIDPMEFDDDPEVVGCLLSDAESAIKERIWVDENAEWLRKDSLKRVKRELKDKERKEKGGGDETGKKGGRKKRVGRMGDVSYLDRPESGVEGELGEGGETGVSGERRRERSMEESVSRMIAHRAPAMSRRINYGVFNTLFRQDDDSREDSDSRTGSRSRSASVASTIGSDFSSRGSDQRKSKASIAAEKREAAKREARTKAKTQADDGGEEDDMNSGRRSSSTPAGSSQPTLNRQQQRAPTNTPPSSPALVRPISTTNTAEEDIEPTLARDANEGEIVPTPVINSNDEELLGSIDDSDLSSLTSSRNSPILGLSGHGFGDEDDDESSGDEDDYVDDDVEAAFEGRRSTRLRDIRPLYEEDDEDDEDA